ncbi:MAG: surface-adhesin E family protein [Gemmatimonadaceae bacterium]
MRLRAAITAALATLITPLWVVVAAQGGGAGRWVEIGKTRSGNPVYVDQKTVKTAKDGIISATIRVAYLEPVKTPKGNVTASRALAMFNCKASTFATKENAMYIDEKSNNIFQRTVNVQPGFGPAISGNFADVALKHFCAK